MSTFIDRLLTEKKELDEKIEKLNAFIGSDNFATIDETQKCLLPVQAKAMSTYGECLGIRIADLRRKDPNF